MASTSLDAPAGVTRPVVFFDINIGETPAGRIKIGTSTRTTTTTTVALSFGHILAGLWTWMKEMEADD